MDRIKSDKLIFSKDLTTHKQDGSFLTLSGFAGQPNLNYLEVGVYEGRTLIWMMENVFSHPTSKATVIDSFTDNTHDILTHNLEILNFQNKVEIISKRSEVGLRYLPLSFYDVIYVDGSHSTIDVLSDVILAWGLLKIDGIMILDDYLLHQNIYPNHHRPQLAIDIFLYIFRDELQVLVKDYDVSIKKLNPISRYSSGVGATHFFSWSNMKLYNRFSFQEVSINQTEKDEIINSLLSEKVEFIPAKNVGLGIFNRLENISK